MTLNWKLERTVIVVVNACDNNTCTYISIVVYTYTRDYLRPDEGLIRS